MALLSKALWPMRQEYLVTCIRTTRTHTHTWSTHLQAEICRAESIQLMSEYKWHSIDGPYSSTLYFSKQNHKSFCLLLWQDIYVYITLKSSFDSRWVSDDVSVTSGCINETTTDEAPPLSRVQWDSWASAGVCLLTDRTYVRVVTRRPAARFMLR